MGLWNTHAERTGVALAGGAVLLVGGSVAASSLLAGYPVLGGQAIRYAVAFLLLAGWARLRHQPLPRPAGREWCWLAGLAAVGLAGCSVLLIMATRAASPAGVGIVIGAAPLIITIAGPVAAGRRPGRRPPGRVLAAAGIVTVGAAMAQLGGATGAGWSLPGLLLSTGALAGVAGTSLLAVPLLPRLGALAVTIYACGLAAALLLAAAMLVCLAGGPPVLRPPTGTELAALLYLAVAVTAVVFVAWFSAVERLGAERTGLFNGLVPIASLIAVAVIGTGTVTGMRLAGALSVLAGVTLGLTQRAGPPAGTRRPGGRSARVPGRRRAKASVDVELVALGVHHPHRVVIEAVGAQGSGERGPEIGQPPGLGVDSLLADLERDVPDAARVRAVGARVDVEVEAVLDHLGVRHHMEPYAGPVTARIDDAVRADSQLTVGKPDVAPPVVPGSEPFGRRFKHVSQGSRPEAGQQLGVLAVDDELESGRHRAPIGSAVARALASMPRVKTG